MKVIILAGGFGTRIGEYTKTIPKPLISILGKPILIHIMELYAQHGFKEFYIALGYKGNVIKKYFKKNKFTDWKINLIDTGKNTMTGGRLKRLKKYINKDETFMMTYGDGLSNVNLKKLLSFHKKNKKIATLTAVRPPARFGALKISGNNVNFFKEKSKLDEGWINGGFFVLEPKVFSLIKSDKTFFEKEPLQILSQKSQLKAYKHRKIWQCMDTVRDKEILEKLLTKKIIKF
jgi:glucose-1-phosphate cytidylyltransferase